MLRYTISRIIQLLPTLFGIYTLVFFMMRVLPSDPALYLAGFRDDAETLSNLRRQLKLDEPILDQYTTFLVNSLQGDLGVSYVQRRPVTELLSITFPKTAVLALTSTLFAAGVGIPLGILSAIKKNSFWDFISRVVALIGVSIPVFYLAIMLQIVFGVQLRWFPISGIGFDRHLILPAICAGLGMLALLTRMTRSSLIETFTQDYVRTARSKGLRNRRIVTLHALRNSLLPVITVWGTSIAGLLSGTLLVEEIFSWPGMGRLLVDSISTRDYPMVQGLIIVFALIYAGVNLTIDLLYPFIDPRIRYRGS